MPFIAKSLPVVALSGVLVAFTITMVRKAPGADTAGESVDGTVSSAPAATRPAEEIVLVRFGDDDARLTQADFNKNARGYPPARYNNIMSSLTRDKLFLLYIRDHPELVTSEVMEEAIEGAVKENRASSRDELEQKLYQRGISWDEMQERLLIGKAMTALIKEGEKNGQDKAYVRKRFEEHPEEFDGTTVTARHIQKTVFPYNTPAEREQQRAALAKIREDLDSGKAKWNDVIQESDCRTRLTGGTLGSFSRHLMITEPVAETAFNMKVGELSEIFESDLGFHIVEVLARQPGTRTFEDNETQKELRIWLEYEPLQIAMREARTKYPPVGVEPPSAPPPIARVASTAPAAPLSPSTQPTRRSKSRFLDPPRPVKEKQPPVKIKPFKP